MNNFFLFYFIVITIAASSRFACGCSLYLCLFGIAAWRAPREDQRELRVPEASDSPGGSLPEEDGRVGEGRQRRRPPSYTGYLTVGESAYT